MFKNDREDTKNLLGESEQNKRHIARINNKIEEMNLHKLHRQKLSDARLLELEKVKYNTKVELIELGEDEQAILRKI